MKLSIVIPLYNKEKFIGRCLNSLLEQDLSPEDYEAIIIDDGSTDKGGEIAREYAGRHANIHFYSQANSGPSVARNKGLDASKGSYIYFLDADDFLATNVLGKLVELAEYNSLEILEFNTREIQEGEMPESSPLSLETLELSIMDGITYIGQHDFRNEAWRYFVSRDLLSNSGTRFIEGTLYEDVIFTASLFLKAKRIAKVEMDVHRYVAVENSIVRSRDAAHNLKFIRGMAFAVEKFHEMINSLNSSHSSYDKVVKKLKARQQALVFALLIRTFRHRLLNLKDLKSMLAKMNKFEAYPIDPKIGGVGNSSPMYKMFFLPILNNKTFLFLGLRIARLIPAR